MSLVVFLTCYTVVKLLAVVNRWQLRRGSEKYRPRQLARTGQTRLLYFSAPECSQCSIQEREIAEAAEKLHHAGMHLEVQRLDAYEDGGLAKSMRVLTVPTTVLLDSNGTVVAWNPGLIRAKKIVDQYINAQ